MDNAKGGWNEMRGWYGTWCENVVQAISRDLLVGAMARLEAAGYPIVLTVTTRRSAEVPDGFGSTDEFLRLVTELPAWAKGLPVAAKVWTRERYIKTESTSSVLSEVSKGEVEGRSRNRKPESRKQKAESRKQETMKQGFAGKPRPQELGGAHYAHEQTKEPPERFLQRPSKDTTKAGGNRQPNGCIKPAPRQGNGASAGAPQTYNGKLDALPAALRPLTKQKNWVVWKWVLKEGASNWTKPPFKAANPKAFAKNNDPSTWSDYATAVAAMKPNGVPFVLTKGMKERLVGKGFSPKQISNMTPAQAWGHLGNPDVNGIGFMLLGSGIAALDLDKCRNPETGELTPWAQEAVDGALALGAYVEVTVSGTGLRIVGTSDGSRLHKPFPKVDGDSELSCIAIASATSPSPGSRSARARRCRTSIA